MDVRLASIQRKKNFHCAKSVTLCHTIIVTLIPPTRTSMSSKRITSPSLCHLRLSYLRLIYRYTTSQPNSRPYRYLITSGAQLENPDNTFALCILSQPARRKYSLFYSFISISFQLVANFYNTFDVVYFVRILQYPHMNNGKI